MEQTRHRRGAKSPPQSLRTKGERRRRAKATPESNKSLQERGGDLHRLQLNHKRRLPQDGPAAAQLRWTMYSGGVLHLLHRKDHDIKESCGVSTLSTRSKELSPSSSYWRTKQNPLQSKQVPGPRADFCECPSSCSPLLHFQEPTTIPSRPAMVYEDHRRMGASDQLRERPIASAPPR